MNRFDVIVIGAGVNGLLCASYLARAGRSVALVPHAKGLARSYSSGWQSTNGEVFPTWQSRLFDFGSEAAQAFHLASFNLGAVMLGGGVSFHEGSGAFVRDADPAAMAERLMASSSKDANAYLNYLQCLTRLHKPLHRSLKAGPGRSAPVAPDARAFFESSMRDVLDSFFESEALKSHLAQAATHAALGSMGLGPYAPTSSFALLRDPVFRQSTEDLTRSISCTRLEQALTDLVVRSGGLIVADTRLERIVVQGGRASGVILTSGVELRSNHVVADVDKHLLAAERDTQASTKVSRARGAMAQINVTFDAAPEVHQKYAALAKRGSCFFNGGIENLERAYDDWRRMEVPTRPPFELVFFPPVERDSRALSASIYISYIPTSLAVGVWDEARRFTLCAEITNEINNWLPDFSNHLTHIETVTPDMYESCFGVSGGIWAGEEQGFDLWLHEQVKTAQLSVTGPGARLFEIESGWSATQVARELLGSSALHGAA